MFMPLSLGIYPWSPLLCQSWHGALQILALHCCSASFACQMPAFPCSCSLPYKWIFGGIKLFKGLGQRGGRGEDCVWWGASSVLNEQPRERCREWKQRGEGFKPLLCTERAGWGGGRGAYSALWENAKHCAPLAPPALCPPCQFPKLCAFTSRRACFSALPLPGFCFPTLLDELSFF